VQEDTSGEAMHAAPTASQPAFSSTLGSSPLQPSSGGEAAGQSSSPAVVRYLMNKLAAEPRLTVLHVASPLRPAASPISMVTLHAMPDGRHQLDMPFYVANVDNPSGAGSKKPSAMLATYVFGRLPADAAAVVGAPPACSAVLIQASHPLEGPDRAQARRVREVDLVRVEEVGVRRGQGGDAA
jgi:hypothetical protein